MNYDNFHRARKWHRKFDSALYSGRIYYIETYSDLYYKYEELARLDGHKILYIKKNGITRMVIDNK